MRRRVIVGTLLLTTGASTVAAAVPAVMPGWPVPAPAGVVLPGPGGGAVATGSSSSGASPAIGLVAVDRDGSRRWASLHVPGCGNCYGTQTARLQGDGTYGPIGYVLGGYRNLDARGRAVRGCAGVALPGGDCIAWKTAPVGAYATFAMGVSREGGTPWSIVEPDIPASSDQSPWPLTVAGPDGTIYAASGDNGVPSRTR